MMDETIQNQEAQEAVQESVAQQAPAPLTSQETNLIAMRKRLEAEESARIAAERRAQELEQRMSSISPAAAPQITAEEEDLGVDNDDYIQAKHEIGRASCRER